MYFILKKLQGAIMGTGWGSRKGRMVGMTCKTLSLVTINRWGTRRPGLPVNALLLERQLATSSVYLPKYRNRLLNFKAGRWSAALRPWQRSPCTRDSLYIVSKRFQNRPACIQGGTMKKKIQQNLVGASKKNNKTDDGVNEEGEWEQQDNTRHINE